MEEKVALVESHQGTYSLNRYLEALGLFKGTWHYRRHGRSDRARQARDEALKERIVSVIEEYPGYAYRRIERELVEQHGERANHKRLRWLLKSYYDLGLSWCLPRSKPSSLAQLVAAAGGSADLLKGRSFSVLQAFSTDFKEVAYAEASRKGWVMVLLDVESR